MFNSDNKKDFGKNLKRLRLNAKLTQEYVAKSLDVSRQAVSKWENGAVRPSTNNLIALAELYNAKVETLIGNKDDTPTNEKPRKSSKRTLYIVFAILVSFVFIHNIVYFSGIFDMGKSDLEKFMKKNPQITCYDSVRQCEKENGEDYPEFFAASHIQSFNMTVIEHNETLDVFFKADDGICRLMAFETDENYPASKMFFDVFHFTDNLKSPILSLKRSKHSVGNYDVSQNSPYIERWFIGDKFVIFLSSSREFSKEIKSKIVKCI